MIWSVNSSYLIFQTLRSTTSTQAVCQFPLMFPFPMSMPRKLSKAIVVQLLSHVWLFVTPWTAVLQASLSITNSRSLLKLMSIELVIPFNHLILCQPLLLLPSNFPQHQGLFKWVRSLHQVAKVLEFSLQHQSLQWTLRTDFLYDGLVGSSCSPRDSQESSLTPWFKASILQHSAFFIVQLLHPKLILEKP